MRHINEIIDSSDEMKKMYFKSPNFNMSIKALSIGNSPVDIIYQLCKVIEKQQEMLENYAMNNHLPIIKPNN